MDGKEWVDLDDEDGGSTMRGMRKGRVRCFLRWLMKKL